MALILQKYQIISQLNLGLPSAGSGKFRVRVLVRSESGRIVAFTGIFLVHQGSVAPNSRVSTDGLALPKGHEYMFVRHAASIASLIAPALFILCGSVQAAGGFGVGTVGGFRPGSAVRVFIVTTIADAGVGTLRECAAYSEPRVCVFQIGGTIELKSPIRINHPYLTISGQTAPGSGITLKRSASWVASGQMIEVRAGSVVIEHLKIRPGHRDPQEMRGITVSRPDQDVHNGECVEYHALQTGARCTNAQFSSYFKSKWGDKAWTSGAIRSIRLSHLSISWTYDDAIGLFSSMSDVTVENCLIGDVGDLSRTESGSKAILIGNGARRVSVIGNVFVHVIDRTPVFSLDSEVIGNLTYNSFGPQMRAHPDYAFRANVTRNFVKTGNYSQNAHLGILMIRGNHSLLGQSKLYTDQNSAIAQGRGFALVPLVNSLRPRVDNGIWKDNWISGADDVLSAIKINTATSAAGFVLPSDPGEAYRKLVQSAGSFPARRDDLDQRLIRELHCGTGVISGSHGPWANEIPADQNQLDLNLNGIPEHWESAQGFISPGGLPSSSTAGTTALRNYLNEQSLKQALDPSFILPTCL